MKRLAMLLGFLQARDGGNLAHLMLSFLPGSYYSPRFAFALVRLVLTQLPGDLRALGFLHLPPGDGGLHCHLIALVPLGVTEDQIQLAGDTLKDATGLILKLCPHRPGTPQRQPWMPTLEDLLDAVNYAMGKAVIGTVNEDGVLKSLRPPYVRIGLRGSPSKKEMKPFRKVIRAADRKRLRGRRMKRNKKVTGGAEA